MNRIKRFLIKAYISIFIKNRKIDWPDKSRKEFDKSMGDFSNRINSFEYKSDPIGGLIDYVAHPDLFFDETRTEGRDCDDWARMWSIWGSLHGYVATEWIICNPNKMFKTMHVITTLKSKEGVIKYYLMNFRVYGPFETQNEALDEMKKFSPYREDSIIVKSISLGENV